MDWGQQGSFSKQVWDWEKNPLDLDDPAKMTATARVIYPQPGHEMRKYFPDGEHGKRLLEQERENMGIGEMADYGMKGQEDPGYQTNWDSKHQWVSEAQKKKHAYAFLETAIVEMKSRAAQRDTQPKEGGSGERSMSATVRAFNALTGHNLTEAEGWEFMILLKLVRGRQGAFRMDDYVDAAAYAALLGECESTAR